MLAYNSADICIGTEPSNESMLGVSTIPESESELLSAKLLVIVSNEGGFGRWLFVYLVTNGNFCAESFQDYQN